MAGPREHRNEFWDFINDGKCFDELTDHQLPMKLHGIRYDPTLYSLQNYWLETALNVIVFNAEVLKLETLLL